MKFIKKLNKGLLLTVIVLLVLIIYLINIETKRNAEKPQIEQAVKEYIELIDKYAVMPEKYQKIYGYSFLEDEKLQKEQEDAIAEYLKKFEEDIKEKTIDNENVIKMQKDLVKELINQKNDFTKSVISKYERKIVKIKTFAFDDDQVTVAFDSEVNTESKYLDDGQELSKLDTQKYENESVTLKHVNDKWKIVYSDLSVYSNMDMFNMIH